MNSSPVAIDKIVELRANYIASVDSVYRSESDLTLASHSSVMASSGNELRRMGIHNENTIFNSNIESLKRQEAFDEAGVEHLRRHRLASLALKRAFMHYSENTDLYFTLAAQEARSEGKQILHGQRKLTSHTG